MDIADNKVTTAKRVCYLSAAPRVSTRPEAELAGPRSHVLGTISGFRSNDWDVESFIVGNHVPTSWIQSGSEKQIRQNPLRTLAADAVRLAMRTSESRRARNELTGHFQLAYERFAAFQSLGQDFQKRGIPWVLETNAPLFAESKSDRQTILLSQLARRLELDAYRRCDRLVCISEALKSFLVDEANIPAAKVIVLPNGVDVDFFDPSACAAARQFTGFTIGFVGSIIEWQGLDRLLLMIAELRQNDMIVNLTLVGDGPARQALEAMARDLQLNEQVKFVGYVNRESVPSYIAGFDIGYSGQIPLQSGHMYLSPLKLYEYMAMSKPVIASSYEDASRIVTDGVTGFLITPQDAGSLRSAIERAHQAFGTHGELVEMGENARQEILANHSWHARVRYLLDQLQLT